MYSGKVCGAIKVPEQAGSHRLAATLAAAVRQSHVACCCSTQPGGDMCRRRPGSDPSWAVLHSDIPSPAAPWHAGPQSVWLRP